MRLFIAVDLPKDLYPSLVAVQDAIKPFGSFSFPHSFHLTLKFLGEIDDADDVIKRLSTIAFQPFSFSLHGTGMFGTRVIWAGITPEEGMLMLQKKVIEALPPKEKFSPHFTLARVKAIRDMRGLQDTLAKAKLPVDVIKIDHFTLYRSTLMPSGAVYDALAVFPAKI